MEKNNEKIEFGSSPLPIMESKPIIDIDLNKIAPDSLQFVLKEKENNRSDGYLIGGLIERGFEYDEAEAILKQLPDFIDIQLSKSNHHLLMGILFAASGLSIKVLPLSGQSGLAITILANSLILLGLLRIIHGYVNKKRFEKIQKL